MSGVTRRTLLARAGAAGAAVALATAPRSLLSTADALAAAPRWPAAWVNELAAELRGGVLVRGNPRYATSQVLFNSRYDVVQPQAIARPIDDADVVAIMRWAARHDVPIAPRGGGHGYSGNAVSDRALVVDLRSMRAVQVSNAGQLATVGGGALVIDVVAALARQGVTVPTGTGGSVGITGLALGGGVGALARQHGLTADRIAALTIVTPDGSVREIDEATEPDLFWACRGGGGGNVGIVTRMQLRTVPDVVETQIRIRWPWFFADDALDAFLETAPDAPNALTGSLAFSRGSGAGFPAIAYSGTYLGPPDEARALVASLTEITGAKSSFVTSTRLPAALRDAHCEAIGVDACRPAQFGAPGLLGRSRFCAGSAYVDRSLDAAGRKTLLRAASLATPFLSGTRSIILAAHGGQVAAVDPDATAFAHRDVRCSVQFFAQSSGVWEDGNARAWVRAARAAFAPHATGGAYVNYLDLDQKGWEDAYYGRSLSRLKAVKAQYDPDLRFRPQQGIPSA